jgi:arylsulfatase
MSALHRFVLVLFLGACSEPGPETGPRSALPARPAVIFLSIDTLGARNTSLHGYARDTTPHLSALAEEAVVFERCLANAPFTGPSYVSQFTGLLPKCSAVDREEFKRANGRLPRAWELLRIPEGRLTLTELLQAAGYHTAAFVDNPHVAAHMGLGQGFELFDDSAARVSSRDPEGGIRLIVPKALAWIDSLPEGEPFFLFANVLDVHQPYLPDPEFLAPFQDDALGRDTAELAVGSGGFGAIDIGHVRDAFGKPPFPRRLAPATIVARYDAEVRAVDEALGRFLSGLRARGLLERTIFACSADHGEAMAQPDYKFGHGTHVEEVLHVPLLLRLPDGAHANRRIAAPVQLLDLFPTLAELLGLTPPAGLQGRSLVPLLAGQPFGERPFWHENGRLQSSAVTEGEWRLVATSPGLRIQCVLSARGRAWLAEHYPDLGGDFFLGGIGEALNTGPRAKQALIECRKALVGPFFELYHLPSDPHLLHDVAEQHPELVQRLKARLKEAQELGARERARLPVTTEPLAAPTSLDELRALGYLGDDSEELEDE